MRSMVWNLRVICLGFACVVSMGLWMMGCGDQSCPQGQVLVEGKCVASEISQESTSNEVPVEHGLEPEKEIVSESKTDDGSTQDTVSESTEMLEPVGEQPTETTTLPEEPVAEDKAEVVPEGGTESEADASPSETEPVVEETPEPYGPVPTVKITSPKNNDVIKKASIEIEVDVSVASGGSIDVVELYIDDKRWSDARQTPYRFSVPEGRIPDGVHTFRVVAITLGYQRATDEIKLTTVAVGPEIKFIKPQANDAFTGKFDVIVEVKSGVGLAQDGVILKIDGAVVAWSKTTPQYEAQFDPANKSYDSLPIEVIATDSYGQVQKKQQIVIYDPVPGPKKLGEECDVGDPQKRCVKDHSCLSVGGQSTCYANCDTSSSASGCQTTNCLAHSCQASLMGTNRGVCYPTGPAPGCLNYECTQSQTCNTGLICVGAGSTGAVRRWCLGTCTPGSVLLGCKQGFKCVSVGTAGVCIELCKQPCKTNSECGVDQTCSNGACGGPFCQAYGAPCRGVQAGTDVFDACI